jgi:hypothetical protein
MISCFLASRATEIIRLFPSTRHLILDINLHLSSFSDFTKVDFSPLAVLGPASAYILTAAFFRLLSLVLNY